MRLWTLHPKYLDSIGLIALWREALLAKKVLENKTIGYKNHPQLIRFRNSINPINAINFFLYNVWIEATNRNYKFDKNKIDFKFLQCNKISVSNKQLEYEFKHLLNKLNLRDIQQKHKIKNISKIECNETFVIVKGEIENWEKL